MAPRDPYQKSFTSIEEMLSNPGTRLRSNPSKAYETVLAAVRESGGWSEGNEETKTFYHVVLSGPMTGRYALRILEYGYAARLPILANMYSSTSMGETWERRKKLNKKLRPLFDAITASGIFPRWRKGLRDKEPKSVKDMRKGLLSRAKYYEETDEDSARTLAEARDARRDLKQFNADPEGYTKEYNEASELDSLHNTTQFKSAETLYILSQAGGVPVSAVIADIQQQPKRLLSLEAVRIPTRLSDRSRYAAEFLRTWSAGKAANRIVPNVEGGMPAEGQFKGSRLPPQDVRDLLTNVPSWRQLVESSQMPDVQPESFSGFGAMSDKEKKVYLINNWFTGMIYRMKGFQKEGISPVVFREQLLRKYTWAQLTWLLDAVKGVRKGAAILARTPEGRLLVRAREERDWPRLLKGHDQAVAAAAAMEGVKTAKTLQDAAKFKQKAANLRMIPGVRPLITKAEYKCEGEEMSHCVHSMGYYLNRDGYEFAFAAQDGTRATLQLSVYGNVIQFFGPHDAAPSEATQKMLGRFLAVNEDNTALMRQGKFPVSGKKSPAGAT